MLLTLDGNGRKPTKTRLRHISRVGRLPNSTMGFRDFLKSSAAIFRLAHKSDRDEFSLYLKLVALGVAVVGTIGFLIKLIGSIFFG
jgi:protein translocase SEC61 complex gamma subunit